MKKNDIMLLLVFSCKLLFVQQTLKTKMHCHMKQNEIMLVLVFSCKRLMLSSNQLTTVMNPLTSRRSLTRMNVATYRNIPVTLYVELASSLHANMDSKTLTSMLALTSLKQNEYLQQ